MRFPHYLLTMVVVAVPVAANAQHGAGRPGSTVGMQQQQTMRQQMLYEQQMMRQQMLYEQQMMRQMQGQLPVSRQHQGTMRQQPTQQQGTTPQAVRQQPRLSQRAVPKGVNSDQQQLVPSRRQGAKMQRVQGKSNASSRQTSPAQQPAQPSRPSSQQ